MVSLSAKFDEFVDASVDDEFVLFEDINSTKLVGLLVGDFEVGDCDGVPVG